MMIDGLGFNLRRLVTAVRDEPSARTSDRGQYSSFSWVETWEMGLSQEVQLKTQALNSEMPLLPVSRSIVGKGQDPCQDKKRHEMMSDLYGGLGDQS